MAPLDLFKLCNYQCICSKLITGWQTCPVCAALLSNLAATFSLQVFGSEVRQREGDVESSINKELEGGERSEDERGNVAS